MKYTKHLELRNKIVKQIADLENWDAESDTWIPCLLRPNVDYDLIASSLGDYVGMVIYNEQHEAIAERTWRDVDHDILVRAAVEFAREYFQPDYEEQQAARRQSYEKSKAEYRAWRQQFDESLAA